MTYKCNSRYSSFRYAVLGIKRLAREVNFRIHIAIAVLTVMAGITVSLSLIEWCIIIICFGLVLGAEGLNTAIEILADRVCPYRDERIGLVKDVAAGAVLLCAAASVLVGVLIFAGKSALILH